MRVFMAGGTGLMGRALVGALRGRGDTPVVLSRRADQARLKPAFKGVEIVQGDPTVAGGWERALDGCDAVINLVGQGIFSRRWDDDVRRALRSSRIESTQNVVAAMARARSAPKVLVSASAIGYYGPHDDEELTESSLPGDDFMAKVCIDWEAAARTAESLETRVAIIRTGVVLDRREGALGAMAPLFKLGGGSPVGSGGKLGPARGRQWLSWIHLSDIVGIFLLALDNAAASGPINGTAPNPVRNADFSRALARILRRPMLPIGPPDAFMRAVLGEVAQVVTAGQRVLPSRAQALGYAFQYPEIAAALADVFAKRGATAPTRSS